MKKLIFISISALSLGIFTACSTNRSESSTSTSQENQTEMTFDSSEIEKMLEEANKQFEQEQQKELAAKQKRIEDHEPMVELTGNITDIFTKPDSGLDIYQITVKVTEIQNDVNDLYKNQIEKEYVFFPSPSEFKELDFSTLKNDMTIKIKTFQDSYVTDSEPKQIDTPYITGIEKIK